MEESILYPSTLFPQLAMHKCLRGLVLRERSGFVEVCESERKKKKEKRKKKKKEETKKSKRTNSKKTKDDMKAQSSIFLAVSPF